MKTWNTVTDNAFNKAWKISCPTCVNIILWFKKQCHECETKVMAKRMYSEEDMREAILTSFVLGVDRGNYSKELEDKLIKQFKKK